MTEKVMYNCMACHTEFECTEAGSAKCPACGSYAVTRIPYTGRHG